MGGWISFLFGFNRLQVGEVNYRVVRRIGEGAFSFVDLVADPTGRQLALKRIEIAYEEQENAVLHEISIHQKLTHPNILSLLNHDFLKRSNNSQEARLVFPYYSRGTIQNWIDPNVREGADQKVLDKKQLLIITLSISICNGLEYMHSLTPPLAHRDLKPDNVLLPDDMSHAVLMDLGSVREAEVRINNRQEALVLQERAAQESTATFRAPELFDCPSPGLITAKTDVWSLGCTIYTMAYGEPPFDGTVMSTLSGRLCIPTAQRGGRYSQGFGELLRWILALDPDIRPGVLMVNTRLREMIAN
ncbi:Serine/threonine-protein kinase 16-like [Oopsacas minuta]|uniref:non-specific serine/threonine protein kinase n=1 Tax=Oopsacas minuta TaxID=111878 RepID=A0AAV7KG96_9METZ|nr:Serine/threonine-protein kinase 16-like [Oopsacas minuta]